MNVEKRQRLSEVIIAIGVLLGIFLSIFQMSFYIFTIFPVFIFFSLIYYVSALENYEKSLSNTFVSLMISLSFSSLFIILLATWMNGVNIFEIFELTLIFGILSFLLTLELSGHSIDVRVVKSSECKKSEK
jgi:hypothetical protein